MKKFRSLLALLLVLMLALPVFSLAEEDAAPETEEALAEDPVLVTIDGEEYTKSYIDNEFYDFEPGDYPELVEQIVMDRVIRAKITEMGFDQFTDEENAAFEAEADAALEDYIQSYVEYFLNEDTDEARARTREEAVAYYENQNARAQILDSLRINAAFDLLIDDLISRTDLSVSDEEIRQTFEEYAEMEHASYGDDIAMYELYDSWYIPAGYRGVLQILLEVDNELLEAYMTAQALYEESTSGDEPEANSDALKAAADEAIAVVLAERQDVIDEIYARLEKGEAFETLISEFNADPGMEDESALRNGYAVHPDTIVGWDPAFLRAVFSDKMQQVGDVSDPFVGMDGIHIVKYLRDVPEGYVELDEDIHTLIEEYLSNQKFYDAYDAALEAWTAEHEIIRNEEAISAAMNGGSVLEEAE